MKCLFTICLVFCLMVCITGIAVAAPGGGHGPNPDAPGQGGSGHGGGHSVSDNPGHGGTPPGHDPDFIPPGHRGENGGGHGFTHHNNVAIANAIATAFACSSSSVSGSGNSSVNVDASNPVQGHEIIPADLMPRIIAKENKKNLPNTYRGPCLNGIYTLDELKENRATCPGKAWGVNVQGERGLFHKHKAAKEVIVVENADPAKLIEKGYKRVHGVITNGGVGVQEEGCTWKSLEEGAKWGNCHVLAIEHNVNLVGTGKGLNIGGNGTRVSEDGAIVGGGGIGWTYALWEGEPFSNVGLYVKLPDENGNVPTLQDQLKEMLTDYQKAQEPIQTENEAAQVSDEEQAPVSKAVNINEIAVFAEQWLAKA